VEYERNGVGQQTITRCMRVNEYQQVFDEFTVNPRFEAVIMGCIKYDIDEGVVIGDYPFPAE
jgi:hypothetical protein